MKTQKTKTAPTQTVVEKSTNDYVSEFCSLVDYCRFWKVEPMASLTVLEHNGEYCGEVLCLYASETQPDMDAKQVLRMTPYFYGSDVANALELRGILIDSTVTRRTGISVTWFKISPTLI